MSKRTVKTKIVEPVEELRGGYVSREVAEVNEQISVVAGTLTDGSVVYDVEVLANGDEVVVIGCRTHGQARALAEALANVHSVQIYP